MRGLRPVILLASLAIVIAALIPLVPSLLLALSGRGSARAERQARADIDQHVNAYATQVVTASTSPAGPPDADLAEFARQKSLRYAADHTNGALLTLWIEAHATTSTPLGANVLTECYTIRLHNLGTPTAASEITHLPTCAPVQPHLATPPPPAAPTPTR